MFRESGENPERLRHCNGIQTPSSHCIAHHLNERGGKAGARLKPEVRIPVWMRSSWSFIVSGQLLRKEKDEASLFRVCEAGLP